MSSKATNAPVIMDARKFVRQINNSASAKLKFFEEAVVRMGQSAGKNLRLTSLDNSNVVYEDVDKNQYYLADIKKGTRGRVHFENIKPIQIVEEDKASQFQKNVDELVENICSGELTTADKIFNKIEGQRFRSKVIPESGWITPRDGVSRHVTVSTRIVKDDHVANIVKLFTEAVKDDIEVDKGRIIRGTLADHEQKFMIPINEYTRRRLIAFKMREHAQNAYKSSAFQELVLECASLVCEGKVEDAVKFVARFLKEEQEFSLLDLGDMKALVENALATRCQFNTMLATDLSKLLYKTNAKVNRDTILEAWTKMARKAEHAGLLTNVNILSESDNFEDDYTTFLGIVFNEEMSVQSARSKAYRTTLRVISSILPDLEGDDGEDLSSSVDELNELVERLSGPEPDTDAVLQAEELLAGISDSLIDSIQDLEGFDSIPGEEEVEGFGGEDEGDLVPLPEVGTGEEDEELPPMDAEEEVPPPMESKLTSVEEMDVKQLLEQLEEYRVHGDSFLAEHGYEQCYEDFERYIKRSLDLGPTASVVREAFEEMRDRLVSTGNEVLAEVNDDVYSDSVMAALNGSNRTLGEAGLDYRHTFLEGEQPWEMGDGLSDASGLRMDDLRGEGGVAEKSPKKSDGRAAGGEAAGYHATQRGEGVAKKSPKSVDGRKGEGGNSGSAGGSTRMDDGQGGGGVQDQGLGSTDGRTGKKKSQTASESTAGAGDTSGGNPAMAKGGYTSVGLSMGSDHQGKGGLVPKSLSRGDGASGDGASGAKGYEASGGPSGVGTDMSEYQGGEGVENDGTDSDKHKGQGKVKSDGGLKATSKGGDMSDLQGSGGVAESITPERIAELIDLMEGLDCGCPSAGGCKDKACKCADSCECKDGAVSEEAKKGKCSSCGKPNFICRGKCGGGDSDGDSDSDGGNPFAKKDGDSDSDSDSECSKCDCSPCECKKDSDSDDGGNPFAKSEDQYKGTSKKYKRGLSKSSVNPMEGVDSSVAAIAEALGADEDTLSEERVAAFVGSPDAVADAVDRALGDLEDEAEVLLEPDLDDLGKPDLGDEEGLDDDLGGEDDLSSGPPEGLGDEDGDLESDLDDALGGEDEDEEGDDEGLDDLAIEGADEGPPEEQEECSKCGQAQCECME